MLRMILAALMLLHGSIHLLGFLKAFDLAKLPALPLQLSKRSGLAWLIAAVLWIAAAILVYLDTERRWYLVIPAILLSQILILQHWQEARWGTIPNLILALVVLFSGTSQLFQASFKTDAESLRVRSQAEAVRLLTERDIEGLPSPVQRYVRQSGAIGKPIPRSMYVELTGRMRAKGKNFFSFTSRQYNDFLQPSRYFFMVADMSGLKVPGYHRYHQGKASMDIRFFGLFPVAQHSGAVMDTTETVTFLNDLCLMAPGAMVYPYLDWEARDSLRAMVYMAYQGIRVSAELEFAADGRLINFVSLDRTEINSGQKLPFSTPIHSYQDDEGRKTLQDGDGVWRYPEGPFVYGQFHLNHIVFNPDKPFPREAFFHGF